LTVLEPGPHNFNFGAVRQDLAHDNRGIRFAPWPLPDQLGIIDVLDLSARVDRVAVRARNPRAAAAGVIVISDFRFQDAKSEI
jgi:hypothetical protein